MVQKESAPSRSVGFYDNAVGDRAFTAQDAQDIFDALLLGFAATFLRSAAKMRRHLRSQFRDSKGEQASTVAFTDHLQR